MKNRLYYGDNLDVLRRYVDDESVDLVYLDPPFNSAQDYNVLFAERDGSQAAATMSDVVIYNYTGRPLARCEVDAPGGLDARLASIPAAGFVRLSQHGLAGGRPVSADQWNRAMDKLTVVCATPTGERQQFQLRAER